jgi:hypothetical protein
LRKGKQLFSGFLPQNAAIKAYAQDFNCHFGNKQAVFDCCFITTKKAEGKIKRLSSIFVQSSSHVSYNTIIFLLPYIVLR